VRAISWLSLRPIPAHATAACASPSLRALIARSARVLWRRSTSDEGMRILEGECAGQTTALLTLQVLTLRRARPVQTC
jgi:hypothetical protein